VHILVDLYPATRSKVAHFLGWLDNLVKTGFGGSVVCGHDTLKEAALNATLGENKEKAMRIFPLLATTPSLNMSSNN